MLKQLIQRKISKLGNKQYSTCINLNDAYILSAVRTPIGCFQGKLSSLSAVQLAVKALTAAFERSCLPKEEIQEIVLGNVVQAGLGLAPAHQVALFSGLSTSIISSTINKACASGMKAVMFGCQLISSLSQEVVAVGGAESLSNVPYILRRKNQRLGNICLPDLLLHDCLNDMTELIDLTQFAEETVKEFNYTREEQDDYALESYAKAAEAQKEKVFEPEIVPVVVKKTKGEEEVISDDEQISRLKLEKFRNLTPDVGKGGTITAGNASGLHDGAAMMILASGNYVLKKNLKPLARIVSYADGSLEPRKFVLAPSVTIPTALVKANLTQESISRWEISETFAVTTLVNMKLLKLPPDRVNIHGGAVSLGHPFGMTGARLIVHLAHVLKPGELGCASISHGSGGASALIIEKI